MHEAQVGDGVRNGAGQVPESAGHELKGLLRLGNEVVALSESQSLPQGSVLRNVEWAVVALVYTANQTRLGRSRLPPPPTPASRPNRSGHAPPDLAPSGRWLLRS